MLIYTIYFYLESIIKFFIYLKQWFFLDYIFNIKSLIYLIVNLVETKTIIEIIIKEYYQNTKKRRYYKRLNKSNYKKIKKTYN